VLSREVRVASTKAAVVTLVLLISWN